MITRAVKDKMREDFIIEKILMLRLRGDLYRYLSELETGF